MFKKISIYPSELQLNKANLADTEAPFLLYLSITNGIILSSKIYMTNETI